MAGFGEGAVSRDTICKAQDRIPSALGAVAVCVSLRSPTPGPRSTLPWRVELSQPGERVAAAVNGVSLAVEVCTSGGDHLEPMLERERLSQGPVPEDGGFTAEVIGIVEVVA